MYFSFSCVLYYEGGKVKGKFISKDNGKTWEFSMEVQLNEAK